METAVAWNAANRNRGRITLPNIVEEGLVVSLVEPAG
jgi:hypothetical protein